jgi:hypothetical protein
MEAQPELAGRKGRGTLARIGGRRATPRPGGSCPQTWCDSGLAEKPSGHRVILASLE